MSLQLFVLVGSYGFKYKRWLFSSQHFKWIHTIYVQALTDVRDFYF